MTDPQVASEGIEQIAAHVTRLKILLDYLHEGDDGTRPDRDFLPRTLDEAKRTIHQIEAILLRLTRVEGGRETPKTILRAEATEMTVNTVVPQPASGDSSASAPEKKMRDWKPRDMELLRKTLSMLCNFVWTKQLRPGEHMWSIPVDKERDFDSIISDAFSELEELRAGGEVGGRLRALVAKWVNESRLDSDEGSAVALAICAGEIEAELDAVLSAPVVSPPQEKPMNIPAWRCKTCGCLWRDNLDSTVSLLNAEQKSCARCEHEPTQKACAIHWLQVIAQACAKEM